MSLLAPEDESLDHVHWEQQSQFFDQAISDFDGGITGDWLREMGQSIPLPNLLMQDSPSNIYASIGSVAIGDEQKVEEYKDIRTKRKGRPKLKLDDPQSVKERRRAQIRVAQQAYRHRKEASVTLIQKENENLKSRLREIQASFSQLLSIALRSNLPPAQLRMVRSLSKVAEQRGLLQSHIKDNDQPDDSAPCPKEPSNSPNFEDYSTDFWGFIQTRSKITNSPYISPLNQLLSAPIPFALRLRIEGLKYGYNLIKNPESSFEDLRRIFKYYLFSDTRDGILRRIHQQLNRTMKFMHRENSPDSTGYYSISELEPKTQEVLLDDGQPYIYSTGVEKHLLERGFNITAGSDFVLIPAGSKLQMSETPTMFDEIRGNREFKLSVNKLLSELLNHGACLDEGPGFRRMEIDKVLQLSIMEAF